MDIEDKTRVVPSLAAKRKGDKPTQVEAHAANMPPRVPLSTAMSGVDSTVFVGVPASRQASASKQHSAASITSLDKTVFASPGGAAVEVAPPSSKTLIKDRFELVSLLGVGGMGAVYRALDRRKVEASDSDPYLAVKLLNDDFKQHPDAFISLQRESRKSQSLAHPNIVTVYDFDRDGDMVFMTMEFLEGAPLDKIIRRNAGQGLDPETAHKILRDVTAALMHAHSQRIVHSDFKPGNIFVTKSKGSKVFDFGIARAVSGGMTDAVGEKTLFDAGTLGALTPAYASLEMLKGEEPCQSDDVYALGCVAYELFTGRHPFNKTPADKAQQQKMRPRKIRQLSRRQWKALERALEFSRERRTVDAAAFQREFFGGQRTLLLGAAVLVVSLSALAAAFIVQYREQAAVDAVYKAELEQKLQSELLQSRIADKKQSIARLLSMASLSVDWERDLRLELTEYQGLAPADTDFTSQVSVDVAKLFLASAREYIAAAELSNGERALARSEAWQQGGDDYEAIKQQLLTEKADLEKRIAQEEHAEKVRLAALEQAERRAEKLAQEKEHAKKIDLVVSKIERQLRCGFSMDIGVGLSASLAELKALDNKKSLQIRPIVAKEIETCLKTLVLENPSRAQPLVDAAKSLLPAQATIAKFKVDYCGHLEAGSGGKGARYSCSDRLLNGLDGPALVRVNGEARAQIAIGRFEVSGKEFSLFCQASKSCGSWVSSGENLPAVGMSVELVQQYLAWLSQQSGYQYRLPTYREWFGAASANGEREQPDRNCYLKYGGIEKGGDFIATELGKANQFGLVNHVGNASEIVIGDGGELLEVGGHHSDTMSACLATTKRLYSETSRQLVGFRVVRDAALK
ncbi:bifunctional serine/threonine-protein kinase/formylglycine-generating enzyme family protein [Simiduia curdlanivorans]|uniref:Protein kinase n=1 Tax=Simiduia curdlanivorans TaxID=1492769 RepID=A0ABV8V4D3_9GAMM|nr:bifunctional serine/threonine-protein kinase/formylglycine-generating enzyme family protein [Simiduia curdlanivorans]MDN3640214.1 bifunctional serine/threonine-protein kinase/formylglycine-generating enzyme family protein [Simiduia curdlanivorans]